jgi:uncharacterized protein YecE (DUF72 family)
MRSAVQGEIRIGISGWRYAPWRGHFYPAGLAQRNELAFASRMLSTIEINGSFYSLQRPESYAAWYAETPADFVFSVKGPRYITHFLQLRNVRVPLANFFASGVLALGKKLGPVLWQLPPRMRFDVERLDQFLSMLPRDGRAAVSLARAHDERLAGRALLKAPGGLKIRHAMEVRNPSFIDREFIAMLRRHRVALVIADTAGRWPLLEDLTADFVYLRLHGDEELYASGYGDSALDNWATRIASWQRGRQLPQAALASPVAAARGRRDVFCYFDNDIKVHAPYDAAHLAARLGARTHTQSGEALASMLSQGKGRLP